MKKVLFFSALVCAMTLGMISCNQNGNVDINAKSLTKHWICDSTDIKFNVNGNVMTSDEFADFLAENKMIAQMVGEKYLPYIKAASAVKVTDFTLNKDYTYELKAITSTKKDAVVTGTWIESNDIITITVDLNEVINIDRTGQIDLVVDNLTKSEIALHGEMNVLEESVSGISAGGVVSFKGHAAK